MYVCMYGSKPAFTGERTELLNMIENGCGVLVVRRLQGSLRPHVRGALEVGISFATNAINEVACVEEN